MEFLLENNLSRLAKWLRFLGYQTQLLKGKITPEALSQSRDRIFITTSRRWEKYLKNIGMRYLVVPRHDWEIQLCLTVKYFNLRTELKLDRCAHCGGYLTPVDKETVKERVPPKAFQSARDFTLCPRCGALFWKGLHYDRMVRMLEGALRRC
ncbi:MAG TPA: hypothetical protein EYP11_05085 [Aquificaceae bacterium]|nr:hypothetical protein [Aquificaceae bacterium]HIQ30806.1 hypothetical protein [Aquifex aeolicus]